MMDNMAFGTYRFMRNMKSVLETDQDIRSTFWSSWIGMNHYTYRNDGIEGVKVVEVIAHTPQTVSWRKAISLRVPPVRSFAVTMSWKIRSPR